MCNESRSKSFSTKATLLFIQCCGYEHIKLTLGLHHLRSILWTCLDLTTERHLVLDLTTTSNQIDKDPVRSLQMRRGSRIGNPLDMTLSGDDVCSGEFAKYCHNLAITLSPACRPSVRL